MKRFLSALLAVMMLVLAVPVCTAAAPDGLPYITSDAVAFMDYGFGADSASGVSPDTAKKGWGSAKGSGVVSLLSQGGTLVASGKGYVGASYTLPVLKSPLLITSKYAGVDYSNPEPASNPACAFKMGKGVDFTINAKLYHRYKRCYSRNR